MNKIDNISIVNKRIIHNPCPTNLTLGGCFYRKKNGENLYIYVNAGSPAWLTVYNVDRGECESSVRLEDAERNVRGVRSYCVGCREDGTVIVAFDVGVFLFELESSRLQYLGGLSGETAVMHPGGFAEDGAYYFGTYPHAALQRVTADNRLELVKTHVVPGNYVKSMCVMGDSIYLGAMNPEKTGQFFRYSIARGEMEAIPVPDSGKHRGRDCLWTAGMRRLNSRYLSVRWWFEESAGAIWDTQLRRWADVYDDPVKCTTTPLLGNDLYFFSWENTHLCRRDIAHHETEHFQNVTLPGNALVYNMDLIEMRDQEKWPGKTVAANTTYYGLFLYNIQTGYWEVREEIGPSGEGKLLLAIPNGKGELFCSLYQGQYAGIYHPETGTLKKYSFQQVEGAIFADGVYYLGRYLTDGGIARLDPDQPPKERENPLVVSTSKGSRVSQDRVFHIADCGDEIAYGSIPDYGRLGGCLAFWNKKTNKTSLLEDIAPDQSITGLAYHQGKLYGTTSIYGGLGIPPAADCACVFRVDAATHTLELVRPLRLKDRPEPYFAGNVSFSPSGKLYVATDDTIVELSADTLEPLDETRVLDLPPRSREAGQWRGYDIFWVSDTVLVTNMHTSAHLVDVDQKRSRKILDFCHSLFLDDDKNLYAVSPSMYDLTCLTLCEK